MSNLGFRHAMQREGVAVVETAVGDRYVLEAMRDGGFTLGGEQSGHVIMLDSRHHRRRPAHRAAPAGAGRGRRERSLADLAAVMQRLPQVLVNVPDVDKARVDDPAVAAAVAEAEAETRRRRAGCCCARAAPSRSCG